MIFLLIGFVLGLAAASFWSFLCDCMTGWMDDTIPESDEPEIPKL